MWEEIIGGTIGGTIVFLLSIWWINRNTRSKSEEVRKEILEILRKSPLKTPTQVIADQVGLTPEKTSELLYQLQKEEKILRFDQIYFDRRTDHWMIQKWD